jgi:predicted ATPase
MNERQDRPDTLAAFSQHEGREDGEGDESPTPTTSSIRRMNVEGLFGQYTYVLPKEPDSRDLSHLFILSGENGTGKTTLLKLLYHALSHQDNEGHRSFLAHTRFRRLAIEFGDGTVFEADRRVGSTGGTLNLSLIRQSRTLSSAEVEVDQNLSVNQKAIKQPDRYAELLAALRGLHIRMHYLSDDRKHQGRIGSTIEEQVEFATTRVFSVDDEIRHRIVHGLARPSEVVEWHEERDSLLAAMRRVTRWADTQVRKGATKGQGDSDTIYSRVLNDIAHSLDVQPENPQDEVHRLAGELEELRNRHAEYHQLGLVPALPADEMLLSIREANTATLPVLYKVLKPYVDVVKARLTALEQVHSVIKKFLDTINEFYRNKSVHFHIDKGFSIRSEEERLDPLWLSSGERQLLLLFCNTILARGHASLFLIDEPELSLNVKWQRLLIQSLLDNTAGAGVQFIMATHSTELIAQHRANVVKLVNTSSSQSASRRQETRHEQADH